MSNISLQNLENYKSDYTNTTSEIFSKYTGLITEYFIQCIENIFIKNINYYKYVLTRGIETLTHVFKLLLLYTKNLHLAYTHCQKSLYYYVEFICQIGDDNHSFLQLNTKDAALFVYKKTIFDINNEYRKEFASIKKCCSTTNNIDSMIKLYSNYISQIVYDYSFSADNKVDFIKHFNIHSSKFSQTILNLSLNVSDEDYSKKLAIISKFDELLTVSTEKKLHYIILFLKKFHKKNITQDIIKKKINLQENNEKLHSLSPTKYINWIFH